MRHDETLEGGTTCERSRTYEWTAEEIVELAQRWDPPSWWSAATTDHGSSRRDGVVEATRHPFSPGLGQQSSAGGTTVTRYRPTAASAQGIPLLVC